MALKTGGFTYQQLTAGQRNDVNNFFFLQLKKRYIMMHDGSESKAESAGIKYFISLPQNYISSWACSSFGSVRSSYNVMYFLFITELMHSVV